jgi:hypothetical protein
MPHGKSDRSSHVFLNKETMNGLNSPNSCFALLQVDPTGSISFHSISLENNSFASACSQLIESCQKSAL